MAGREGAPGDRGARPARLTVLVHDRPQAEAALALEAELGLAVTLAASHALTRFAGVGYLVALGELVGRPILVDCGDEPGTALEALRAGVRALVLRDAPAQIGKLRDIARQLGAEVLDELPSPVIALAPGEDAAARLRALFAPTGPGPSSEAEAAVRGAEPLGRGVRRGRATMRVTPEVKKILSWYESENPGVKTNLVRLLMHGRLGGTGKLVILPVDQGFEHGPARSFAPNPAAYDPHYLFELAIEAGLSAYAAPLGALEQGAATYAGEVPLILKLNSANSLHAGIPDQAVTASVDDALRLGCIGVGFTIYPGSEACYAQQEELREIAREAKSKGLLVVVWSYPRGGKVSKEGETALDIVAYAAHMAALMGAHVIKVKPPSARIDLDAARPAYEKAQVPMETLSQRVAHVVQAAFNGKRLVVFSGGEAKDTEGLLAEVRAIRDGGGHGSIIGRNSFQRKKPEALALLEKVVAIYRGEA